MSLVELVSCVTSDGVRLDGVLQRSEARVSPTLDFDAVILHHGFGGNFYARSFFAQMQESFAAEGVAVLRVNNRGRDFAFNSAKGMLGGGYEVLDESRLDWRAWLDLAESLGYQRVLLWGQSLGAVKTVYYLATEEDARVPCAIATSPPRFSYEDCMTKEDAPLLRAGIASAERLIAEGKPDAMTGAEVPRDFRLLSARTYLDKWGPGERYNVLQLLPRVRVPILVAIGSEEGKGPSSADWLQFGGFAPRLASLAEQTPNLTFELIDGANHAYSGKSDVLWATARAWLAQTAGAKAGE